MYSILHHADAPHLLANLAVLLSVAPRVLRALGWVLFVALFTLAGLLANASSAVLLDRPVIGASGSVAAIMAVHLVLFPSSRLAPLIGLWIALQVIFASVALDFGGVAWCAHLVGAAAGAAVAFLTLAARRLRARPSAL